MIPENNQVILDLCKMFFVDLNNFTIIFILFFVFKKNLVLIIYQKRAPLLIIMTKVEKNEFIILHNIFEESSANNSDVKYYKSVYVLIF